MKKILFYTAVILTVFLLLIRADYVIRYAKDAMNMCYSLIIPTLFPFFVCSGLLIYSGFCSVLAKAAEGFMRPLFNVSPSGAAAFVLGIISGFPLGALTACQLYQSGQLSKSEAERLLAFCNNSGPLFIIGSVGTAVYGRPLYGVILYAIHIVSSVIVGVLFRFYGKNNHVSVPRESNGTELPISEVFGAALSNASKSILTVCFAIIFFSAVSRALLELLPLSSKLDAIVSGLCEFSTGVLKTSMLDSGLYEKFVITSLIVGFSGLSVHLQVMAVTSGSGLSLKPYILGKLLHGITAAAITAVVLYMFPVSASVFSGNAPLLSASFVVIPLMLAAVAAIVFIMWCCCKISSRKDSVN